MRDHRDEFTDFERIPADVSLQPAQVFKSAVSTDFTIIPPHVSARTARLPPGGRQRDRAILRRRQISQQQIGFADRELVRAEQAARFVDHDEARR